MKRTWRMRRMRRMRRMCLLKHLKLEGRKEMGGQELKKKLQITKATSLEQNQRATPL